MKPKQTYQILLIAGLFELLLFMVLSKSSPLLLWQSLEDFILGNAYELWPFLHGMLGIFLLLMSLSYLVFSKKGEEAKPNRDLLRPSILAEIDYGKEEKGAADPEPERQSKALKKEKEILPEEDIAKKEKIDPELKPPHTKKDHSPMLESPPPGAPTKRPPDSNRKLL